ncbi:MAG: metallophosphoesterase family protein, partial [Nocardioides sp.]
MFVIAHVSDTHVGNESTDAGARADRVLDHLLAMDPRPDALVVTGDVADHGLPEEYDAARAWLDRWPGPLAVCPGNHDVRDAFAAGLGLESTQAVQAGGSRFLMLDSLICARDGVRVDEGLLTDESLTWLDA